MKNELKVIGISVLMSLVLAVGVSGFSLKGVVGGGGGEGLAGMMSAYKAAYHKVERAQGKMAQALGLEVPAVEEVEGLSAKEMKGRIAAAKAIGAQIVERLKERPTLSMEEKLLLVAALQEYAAAIPDLQELVADAKNIEKPKMTDLGALADYELLMKAPAFTKDVMGMIPTLLESMKALGIKTPDLGL